MLELKFPHADHQTCDAIGMINVEQSLGKLGCLIDIAVGKHGEKRAAEQIGIMRIELEHVEVIGGRGGGIALRSGMPGGQIAPGGVLGRKLLVRRRLNGSGLDGKRGRKAQG